MSCPSGICRGETLAAGPNSGSATEFGAPRSRFRDAVVRLSAAQKPGSGVPAYTRWVNRRVARWFAAGAFAMGWQPNTVTIASATLSFAGITLLVALPPQPLLGPVVAVLLALGYVLDSADGQVARLYGLSSRAGEWLDHVVDAVRSPAIHAGVAVATMRTSPDLEWFIYVALGYCIVTSAQFLSQILAEALVKGSGGQPNRGGTKRSLVLLPTDPGVLCWSFVLWGFGGPFRVVYLVLAVIAVAHSGFSMRRRYRDLRLLDRSGRA